MGDGMDLKRHFYANQRWFFVLAALLLPIDGFDTLLKGWDHFVAQGSLYILTLHILFILSLSAAYIKSEKYHSFFAIFFLLYLLAFIGINLRVLE